VVKEACVVPDNGFGDSRNYRLGSDNMGGEMMELRPYAWYCPVCKKFDIAHEKEQMAKPEHIAHRGVDIGSCNGRMIRLYTDDRIRKLEKAAKLCLEHFELELSDDPYLIDSDFREAYLACKEAFSATE
jgi:hypothetical protein